MTKKELDDFVDVLRLKRTSFVCEKDKYFYVKSVKDKMEGTWDHELICKKNDKYICDADNSEYLIINTGVFVFDSNVEYSFDKDDQNEEYLIFKAKNKEKNACVKYYDNQGSLVRIDNRLKPNCSYSFDISKCDKIKFENYEVDYSKLNYVNKNRVKPENIKSETRFLTCKIVLDKNVECDFVTSREPSVWNWTL